MSWSKRVVWSEGMFLQPQHFQQHDRYLERVLETRVGELSSHPWGFAHLDIDESALALGKVALTAARGVLPDGSAFDFPDCDGAPLALEIPADSKNELLMLAVPARRYGSTEVDAQGVTIEPHDVLCIRTGVMKYWYELNDKESFYDGFNEPGLTYSRELVEWFQSREIPNLVTEIVLGAVLTVYPRLVHRGKSLARLEGRVTDAEGRTVAFATGTFTIYRPR